MPVFQPPTRTSEQLHGRRHTAVLRQRVVHTEENAITQLHIASSPHWIRFGLIHPFHSKMTAIVALNSGFKKNARRKITHECPASQLRNLN